MNGASAGLSSCENSTPSRPHPHHFIAGMTHPGAGEDRWRRDQPPSDHARCGTLGPDARLQTQRLVGEPDERPLGLLDTASGTAGEGSGSSGNDVCVDNAPLPVVRGGCGVSAPSTVDDAPLPVVGGGRGVSAPSTVDDAPLPVVGGGSGASATARDSARSVRYCGIRRYAESWPTTLGGAKTWALEWVTDDRTTATSARARSGRRARGRRT